MELYLNIIFDILILKAVDPAVIIERLKRENA